MSPTIPAELAIDKISREILAVNPTSRAAMRAEATAMLRLHYGAHEPRPDADLPEESARYLAELLLALHGPPAPTFERIWSGRVRLHLNGDRVEQLQRYGLANHRGETVVGMPPALVAAAAACPKVALGAVRGSLLAAGAVATWGSSLSLRVACDDLAAALAVRGFQRRIGFKPLLHTRAGETTHSVVLRRSAEMGELLLAVGAFDAADSLLALPETRSPEALGSHNRRRAVDASRRACTRVEAALKALGEHVPPELVEIATLRLRHPAATLAEIGAMCSPALSKDAAEGRIRRLVRLGEEAA